MTMTVNVTCNECDENLDWFDGCESETDVENLMAEHGWMTVIRPPPNPALHYCKECWGNVRDRFTIVEEFDNRVKSA